MADLAVVPVVSDLLTVVFIHGFKGTDSTFLEFPERLQHVLTETIPNTSVGLDFPSSDTLPEYLQVECIVFPAYEVYTFFFCCYPA
jgi:hypothetical protein